MAAGRIEQQIDLKVTGLKDVKEAEKLVDDLDGKKAKTTVEVEATKATRTVKDILDDVKKLDSQDAQIVLSLRAAAVEKDLTDILEKVAKADADKATIDVELEHAAELRGDLEQLKGAIKELDDTKVDVDVSKTKEGFEDVGKSADAAKSVSANAIGNMTQDFGELGGVAGSAGVAVGQFGEYFADAMASGEESIGSITRNFVTMAGPLTAATIAVGVLLDAWQSFQQAAAETKAFRRERVDAFVDALADARLGVDELAEALQTGGEGRGIFIRVADETKNADVAVAKLFGTIEDFNDAIARGQPGYDAWAQGLLDAAKAANASSDYMTQLKVVLDDARDGAVNATAATVAQSAGLTTVQEAAIAYASAIRDTGDASNRAAFEARFYGDATKDAAAGSEELADATEAVKESFTKSADAAQKQADALNAVVDAATSAADSQLAANDAFARFGELLGDNEASANDVRDAAIDLAKANVRVAQDQAAANGQTLTSTERLDAQNAALLSTAAAAKGPARTGILDYIGAVNQIPPDKVTEIQAAIDAGDLATAQRLLNEASRTRTAAINADANTAQANRDLDYAARDRTAKILAQVQTSVKGLFAGGTSSVPTPGGLAGEAGPELVKVPGRPEVLLVGPTPVPPGTRVTSVTRTRAILARGGRHLPRFAQGGVVPMPMPVNVTLNMRAGVIGSRFEVERAVRRATRDGIRLAGKR